MINSNIIKTALLVTLLAASNHANAADQQKYSYKDNIEGVGSFDACKNQAIEWSTTSMMENIKELGENHRVEKQVALDSSEEQTTAWIAWQKGKNWNITTVVCEPWGWNKTEEQVSTLPSVPDLTNNLSMVEEKTLKKTWARDQCIANILVFSRVGIDMLAPDMRGIISQTQNNLEVQIKKTKNYHTSVTHSWCVDSQPNSNVWTEQ